MQFLP
jgi:hypothetical protein